MKDTTQTKSTSVNIDSPNFSNNGTRCRVRDARPSFEADWVSGWPDTCQVWMALLNVGDLHVGRASYAVRARRPRKTVAMHYMVDLDGHLRKECFDYLLPNQSHQQPNNALTAARLVPLQQRPRTAPPCAPRHAKTPRPIAQPHYEVWSPRPKSKRRVVGLLETRLQYMQTKMMKTHTQKMTNSGRIVFSTTSHAQFSIVLRVVFATTGFKKQEKDKLLITAVYDSTPSQQGTATAAHTRLVQSTSCTVVAVQNEPA